MAFGGRVVYADVPESNGSNAGKVYVADRATRWARKEFKLLDPKSLPPSLATYHAGALKLDDELKAQSKVFGALRRAAAGGAAEGNNGNSNSNGNGNGSSASSCILVVDLASPMGMLLATAGWSGEACGARLQEVCSGVVLVLPDVEVSPNIGSTVTTANLDGSAPFGGITGMLAAVCGILSNPVVRVAVLARSRYYDKSYRPEAIDGLPRAVAWAMAAFAAFEGSADRLVGDWKGLVDTGLIEAHDILWEKRAYCHTYVQHGFEEAAISECREKLEAKRFEWQSSVKLVGLLPESGNTEQLSRHDLVGDKVYLYVGKRAKLLLKSAGFEEEALAFSVSGVKAKIESCNMPEICVIVDASDAAALKACKEHPKDKAVEGLREVFPKTPIYVMVLLPSNEDEVGWANIVPSLKTFVDSCQLNVLASYQDPPEKGSVHNQRVEGFVATFFGRGSQLTSVTSHLIMFPSINAVTGYFETEADLSSGTKVTDCGLIDYSKYPDLDPGSSTDGSWFLASSVYGGSDDRCNILNQAACAAVRKLLKMYSMRPIARWTSSCADTAGPPRRATAALSSSFLTVLDKACQAFAARPSGIIYTDEELDKEAGPSQALFDLSDLLDQITAYQTSEWTTTRTYDAQAGMQDLMSGFKEADKDGNGTITMNDLVGLIMDVQPQLSESDVKALCAEADLNKDGNIDFSEFIKWVFQ
eukprot:TRINITY_DN17040_c0_g1_i1.p1 TRINITY_DN17040_c0_g1~~TRINITY_DN17040_c0_g1_i1.p1  ORF type:complete len:724 (-),score=161.40 TRINITY_DN17040_c0_g1_i1:105-2210(-)